MGAKEPRAATPVKPDAPAARAAVVAVLMGWLVAGAAGWPAGPACAAPGDAVQAADLPDGLTPWLPSRYGAHDQIGTLNEITPEVVAAAARLAQTGRVADLGRVLDEDTPKFPGRYWHQTVDGSPHLTN